MNEELISIHEVASKVSEAIETRHSIREYEQTPIPEEVLQRIFAKALRSPSWKNSQPWKVHIVSGEKRKELAESLTNAAKTSSPIPETNWP